MEPEGLLPHLQQPAICPYSQAHHIPRRSISILSSHLRLVIESGLLPSVFRTKTLYAPLLSPIRAACPAHLSHFDLITRIIEGTNEPTTNFSILYCRGPSVRHWYEVSQQVLPTHEEREHSELI